MKKRSFAAIFPVLLLGTLAVVFADNNTVEMESRILDKFDGTPYVLPMGYLPDGTASTEEFHFTWKAVASKFTTKTQEQSFPVIGVVNTAPEALMRLAGQRAMSLGVQGCFDRRGHNWIDVYPTASGGDGSPTEIPLYGRTRAIDLWVWGANLDYTIEAYLRDNRGMVHVIQLNHTDRSVNPNTGNLKYVGWKNLRGNIPPSIPLVANIIPRSTHDTTFVKFRIWTDPAERPYLDVQRDVQGNITKIVPFYVYITQLKVLTDVYETTYDGDLLANPNYINKLWSEATESGAGAGSGNAAGGNAATGNTANSNAANGNTATGN